MEQEAERFPRWGRLALCVGAATAIWLSPGPAGLPADGWHTFAIFVGVISGFLLRPLEMAPIVLLGLTALVLSGTADIAFAIESGFGNKTVWLVVAAFLIAGAVERTGLGRRIALLLLLSLGRSVLGIAYAISATELVLGPFIPSNTARGGGIIAPIVKSLATTLESQETGGKRRGGAYLAQVGSHSNLVCSAMFLTAMAGNLLLVAPAKEILGVDWDFATWLKGSIVPGLVGLSLVPLCLYVVERPQVGNLAAVRSQVREQLRELGRWSRQEILLSGILVLLLVLWSLSKRFDVYPTTIAFVGILLIILAGVQSWKDIASTRGAWDALIWLGGFVALAEALKTTGLTSWMQTFIQGKIAGGEPLSTTLVLGLVYFASMYFFSQLTAHITALAPVFLALAHNAEAPPYFALAIISYSSCLCGAMTPWSSGPVIIYFGFGYVSVGRWMRNGHVVALCQIAVWLGLGMIWWKFLDWW